MKQVKFFLKYLIEFFICCILEGLEYIHCNKVIHRDIKPENLVLDSSGYLRITDFGVAKYFSRENSSETSGTPGYMAPEVMCSQNHSYAVDFFAVGVIGYEFMNGFRPYYAKSRREIKELILSKQVQIKKSEIPEGWSIEAADFINKVKLKI
jgi:serine/threonine protein kinase